MQDKFIFVPCVCFICAVVQRKTSQNTSL